MPVYVYFVLTAAGYFLKLEFVRKMVGFYGQVTNSEQLSVRKRFNPDKLYFEHICPEKPTCFWTKYV